ncbi:MAG: T9SS type A sorting domain-containing protein, partial [Bacteroidota bacterium]
PNGEAFDFFYAWRTDAFYPLPSAGKGPFSATDDRFYQLKVQPLEHTGLRYFTTDDLLTGEGLVYHDQNENGLHDPEEPGVPGQAVRVAATGTSQLTYTNVTGQYTRFSRIGASQTVSVEPSGCWDTTTPASVPLVDGVATPNFGLRMVGGAVTADAHLRSGPVRCGFTVPFWLSVVNDGCRSLADVTVSVRLPSEVHYQSASVPPGVSSGDSLVWTLSELSVGESWSSILYLTMPNEEFVGQVLPFISVVKVLDADGSALVSTTNTYEPTLRCAIDPNDKLVYPARTENNYTQIDEALTYTIRFQNTGNDTAFNVRLEDQLSPDLDLQTFKPLAASHPHRIELTDDGLLRVFFDNILLPDSNVNYQASNGFFSFAIAIDSTALDRELANTAGIYFDFNAPVITNTVINSIVEFLDEDADGFFFWEDCNDENADINPDAFDFEGNGVDEDCDGNDGLTAVYTPLPGKFTIFPNPTVGVLELRYSLPDRLLVEVFDGRGRRVQIAELRSRGRLDLGGLPAAVYQIKLTDPRTGRFAGRRVVLR